MNKHTQLPDVLRICENADVVLLKNIDVQRSLVNGLRCSVVSIDLLGMEITLRIRVGKNQGEQFKIRFEDWEIDIDGLTFFRKQFPVALDYCSTIHKYQGQTIQDSLRVVLTDSDTSVGVSLFEPELAYVGISRVTTASNLHIHMNSNPVTLHDLKKLFLRHPTVAEFQRIFEERCKLVDALFEE
jgi:hypothetical protein